MDHRQTTLDYYGWWLGADAGALSGKGFVMRPLARREAPMPGYAKAFSVYALAVPGLLSVSYAPALHPSISRARDEMNGAVDAELFACVLPRHAHVSVGGGWKFVYAPSGPPVDVSRARMLTNADFPAYRAFFWTLNPGADTSWLEEYFLATVAKGISHGVFEDDRLVSATDAPDMPHMADRVAEIGINTLPSYRGRGYAKAVCAAAAQSIEARGMTPMWSCKLDNAASYSLALSIGFAPLARYVTASAR